MDQSTGGDGGKPTSKLIEEVTDKWAFLVKELDVKLPENFAKDMPH